MSVSGISYYFQAQLPLLEKYILASNKEQFLQSITSQLDRKLLSLLANPLPQTYEQLFKELNLPHNIRSQLLSLKLTTSLRTADQGTSKSEALDKYVKQFYNNMVFEYPKPAQTTVFASQDISGLNTELSEENSKLTLEGSLAEHLESIIEKDWRKFQTLSQYGIKQLKTQYLMGLSLDNKKYLIGRIQIFKTFSDDFVTKFILNVAQQTAAKRKVPFFQQIPQSCIQMLSKSQINLMKSTNPQVMNNSAFVRRWFQLNCLPSIEQPAGYFKKKRATLSEMDQRRKTLLSVRQELKKVGSTFLKPYEKHLFFEILVLDLKREDPAKQLFFQFLQNMQAISVYFNNDFRKVLMNKKTYKAQTSYSAIRSENLLSAPFTFDKLIESYMKKLFKKYKNHEQLKLELIKYLDSKIVNVHYAMNKLQNGEEVDNLHEVLQRGQIEGLKKTKEITIVQDKTQKFFKAQDDVFLTLRIKNVKQIKLKVYEMDIQQFYLENLNSQIDQTINLQYLNPTLQQLIQVKGIKSPHHVIELELALDKIEKKCGFYIVELVGQGITSRAVIRKGAIACFQENHIDGKLLKFYDQSGSTISNIKLWVKGRQQHVTNGQYLIPFSKNDQTFKIVAVKDNYAQRFEVRLTKESYTFYCGLIYNHESFIVGKKSKIILHPILKLGQQKISLKNMQNVRITAGLLNNQNIQSSEKFQKVELSDEKDYIIQIPIKSYTKTITIQVQAQVKDIQDKVVKLSYNRQISIDLLEGSNNFMDIYLKRTNKGRTNIMKATGLNGQVVSNLDVNLFISFEGTTQTQNKVLRTNSEGQLNLGTLDFVTLIKAQINTSSGSISRNWNFADSVEQIPYINGQLIYHESDDIIIPLPFDWELTQDNLAKHFVFSKTMDTQNQQMYENNLDLIKISNQENQPTHLKMQKMAGGQYELRFLKLGQSLCINVIQGKKWPNGSIFSDKTGEVYKISQSPYLFVSMGQLRQQKSQKQDTRKICVPINIPEQYREDIDVETIRAHVILKNNSDSVDLNMSSCFNFPNYVDFPSKSIEQITYKQNRFLSNKQLSDQQAYVLNRQNEKQFIGNNLQKPRVFLKRIEVRDTSENQQSLAKQGAYSLDDEVKCNSRGINRDMCYEGGRMNQCKMYCPSSVVYGLNTHNNYFSLSGHSLLNANYQKVLQITIPHGYTQVVLNLITNESVLRKTFYLSEGTNQNKKDLRHLGLEQKNQNTGWSMSRQIYPVQKGEKRQINRDSVWCTVSLANILQFAQIKGHKLPIWISQWRSYSLTKKLQFYDKQACHQLNVFIKKHDSKFFTQTVEPFIKNKITKTFVDLCLLNDKKCLSYAAVHKVRELNQFEKVLLIESLVQNGLKSQATGIATSMQLYQKSIKRSFEVYKQLFDVVLNSMQSVPKPEDQSEWLQANGFSMPPQQSEICYAQNGSSFSAPRMMMARMAPQSMMMAQSSAMDMAYDQSLMQCAVMQEQEQEYASNSIGRNVSMKKSKKKMAIRQPTSQRKVKPGFKQVQKTKQYTQTTYAGMKTPKLSQNLVPSSLFWSHLATYIVSGSSSTKSFLSQAFLYFSTQIQFTLACCFLSGQPNAQYQLSNQGQNFIIEPSNTFLIFVKQVKELQYKDKFGVLINQRFFNPQERFTYEDDGTQIQKTVQQFIVKKPYTLQTVVTNTSGTNLELQLLMDVPSGAIPLMSHEYVQIINENINSYSTRSFERYFYFPSQGTYQLYAANASRNNVVIAKAKKLPEVQVKLRPTVNKLQSFSDVMRSGSKKEILQYIDKRNIYDPNIFSPYSIMWMLNDKEFFNQVITILRKRNYFDSNIWSFGIYHKDQKCTLEYIQASRSSSLKSVQVPIFQYFPYFSRRTHKFLNQSKSTIRNVQFKQTYKNFIISVLVQSQFKSAQKMAFAYYLLIQDRIDECSVIFNSMTQEQKKSHGIQADYLECYLSMFKDYPNFTTASQISQKYQKYPISTWGKMFKQIYDTLKQYKQDVEYEQDSSTKVKSQFKTTYINQGQRLKVSMPGQTKVQVYFYDINLELYFSDYPFDEIKSLSVVKPKLSKVFASGQSREQKVDFSQVQQLGNMIVQIYEYKQGIPSLKVGSFFWENPKIKVKMSQNEGSLQVFYQGKKQTGCYVKVYSTGSKGTKFYRDGYTDITGKFKYALSDLQGLTKFSILTITKQGGVINQIAPPSTAGFY